MWGRRKDGISIGRYMLSDVRETISGFGKLLVFNRLHVHLPDGAKFSRGDILIPISDLEALALFERDTIYELVLRKDE